MYVVAEGNYSKIVTQQNHTFMVSRMLKEFELYLGNDKLFMRINKSTLANPNFIKKYSKGEPCIVSIQNGQTFEVSRRKKQEILDRIHQREV
ncbi:MAG: LytTR family transcriptional regulator [Sphingobacteriales bacterium]|nr:MAG: LytTR family transcriptional regulator [Sphingobacteriales bacterium]